MPSAHLYVADNRLIPVHHSNSSVFVIVMQSNRGGDLGGRSPQKFEVGGRPMHPSPNILRSSLVGCARKYEQSKKGVIKEFFAEIGVLVRKGSYTTFHSTL